MGMEPLGYKGGKHPTNMISGYMKVPPEWLNQFAELEPEEMLRVLSRLKDSEEEKKTLFSDDGK